MKDFVRKFNHRKNILNYNESLIKIGGFGKYQTFTTFMFVIGLMTGSWIVFGLGYLICYPQYECFNWINSEWEPCN